MKTLQHKFSMKLFCLCFFAALFFQSGCGIVGVIGTPGRHERKIAAEYDIAERKGQKILALVNQPVWVGAQVNLRLHITEAINKNLVQKVKIRPEYIVDYNELSEFRSNRDDFSLLSPIEVGRAMGADMVLLVTVEDYQLGEPAELGFYKASIGAEAVLINVADGKQLWPESEKSKSVQVSFDIEEGGREAAVKRLVTGCAHCVVRYLYDCPKEDFKIFDDKSDISWKSWDM